MNENEILYNQVILDIDKWTELLQKTRLHLLQSDYKKLDKTPFMAPRLAKDHKKADAAIILLEHTTKTILSLSPQAN